MADLPSQLAVLIQARRSGDHTAMANALTRLADSGCRIIFGDQLPPPRNSKCPAGSAGH